VFGALVALWLASLITFLATNLSGIDPARAALGRLATAQQVVDYRQQQGLDRPVVVRYWVWLEHVAQGEWGFSLTAQVPTADLVPERAERSLILAGISILLAIPIALGLGALAAWKAGGKVDHFLSAAILLVVGVPEFVVGLALLYLVAARLQLLPPTSSAVSFGSTTQVVQAYGLPALTLALVMVPYIARMVRGSVREVLAMPYVRAARLRGVPTLRLFARHVFPNAAGPVVNVIALSLAEILAGEVIVENVFGFPGLGQLTVFAASTIDIAVVQVCVLLTAGGFILMSLLADAALVLLNPRLRRAQVSRVR
jgi:peptide/nickel transport system permease protein